jgi:prepilin-type N-terminal cleavage/methylation domain-containing protein
VVCPGAVILLVRGKGLELHAYVKRQTGFSLTELVVALAVALVLMAVGLPAFLRAYHSYQLSGAATQVANILRLTRYEAIRLNKNVDCIIQPSASDPGMTNLWADSNWNGTLDPTEKMILLGNSGNLVDSGSVPNTATLIANAVNSVTTNAPSPGGSQIWFDARGAVIPPTPTNVNVFYLASSVAPEAGYRAVLLMPAGSIQIWTADTAGNWQQLR